MNSSLIAGTYLEPHYQNGMREHVRQRFEKCEDWGISSQAISSVEGEKKVQRLWRSGQYPPSGAPRWDTRWMYIWGRDIPQVYIWEMGGTYLKNWYYQLKCWVKI